jgi:hypothetical protein
MTSRKSPTLPVDGQAQPPAALEFEAIPEDLLEEDDDEGGPDWIEQDIRGGETPADAIYRLQRHVRRLTALAEALQRYAPCVDDFSVWLLQQSERDDSIGDLSRDTRACSKTSAADLRRHLRTGGREAAFEVFRAAMSEWLFHKRLGS